MAGCLDPVVTLRSDPAVLSRVAKVYRADIDGLRAFAVVAVVLFHLNVGIAKGGFIGVDIFFVISGYLITGILHSEMADRTFSIVNFYERRARRLFPALFIVILGTTVAAIFLLFPPELIDFAKSSITAALFSSNMYFMMTTDYFNAGAQSNPLIHTWSLAVEEQFYIVFPFLLYILRGLESRALTLAIGAIAFASFILSVELVTTDQTAAFYLAPSRAWEFLIGALLALKIFPKARKILTREVVATLGAALIIVGCFHFYNNMPFPGVRALVPCLGAALLIHAGASGPTVIGRFISLRPIVFIGLISYSLYLWHWPIILFFRLWWEKPIEGIMTYGLALASFVVATLSWFFIERPFRERKLAASRFLLWGAALAGTTSTLALAVGLLASGGLSFAFSKEAVRLSNYIHYDQQAPYRLGSCFIDAHSSSLSDFASETCLARSHVRPNLLLVGDSHAAHLWTGLIAALPSVQVLQVTATGCKPVFGTRGHPTCVTMINRALEKEVATGTIDEILLSARWESSDIGPLVATVDRLASHNVRVFVSGPIVEYRESLPRLLARSAQDGNLASLIAARLDAQRSVDDLLSTALHGHHAVYLSPYRTLCKPLSSVCRTMTDNGIPLQWDYGHLTAEGSEFIAKSWLAEGDFEPIIDGHPPQR